MHGSRMHATRLQTQILAMQQLGCHRQEVCVARAFVTGIRDVSRVQYADQHLRQIRQIVCVC
jgi:hypothetical protein